MSSVTTRPTLGDFASIVCLKTLIVGIEEALGPATANVGLLNGGRARGRVVAEKLQVTGTGSLEGLAEKLDGVLGEAGTRLCRVHEVRRTGEGIVARLSETVCSAGEPQGSPRKLSFTLGVIQGALEATLGQNLRGTQTGSVLRGADHDEILFVAR